ncbi:uncharacterized protein LOC141584410 [Saimiri boliviensis]|uniref:uncharacterized protein LOC141584410 n=1 Tax=Saimiri boliviensis TaxID=27679 RepID=UPI003D78069C
MSLRDLGDSHPGRAPQAVPTLSRRRPCHPPRGPLGACQPQHGHREAGEPFPGRTGAPNTFPSALRGKKRTALRRTSVLDPGLRPPAEVSPRTFLSEAGGGFALHPPAPLRTAAGWVAPQARVLSAGFSVLRPPRQQNQANRIHPDAIALRMKIRHVEILCQLCRITQIIIFET